MSARRRRVFSDPTANEAIRRADSDRGPLEPPRSKRDKKRRLIDESLIENPHLSDRQHGDAAGADHKTVAARRRHLVALGEIPHAVRREDSTGRWQPVSRYRAGVVR